MNELKALVVKMPFEWEVSDSDKARLEKLRPIIERFWQNPEEFYGIIDVMIEDADNSHVKPLTMAQAIAQWRADFVNFTNKLMGIDEDGMMVKDANTV